MIKGLYAAASAMIANVDRQQAISHNVANLDTPGFKQVLTSLGDFTQTAVVSPQESSLQSTAANVINGNLLQSMSYMPGDLTGMSSQHYVGNLGLGVESAPQTTDFEQGALKQTEQDLDTAIDGNGFYEVQTPDGERYTRDGRFLKDASGQLVTVDGNPVLDVNGKPIHIPEGKIGIDAAGAISVNGAAVAKLGIAVFTNPVQELTRDGLNTYMAQGAPTGKDPGQIRQGYLEGSNANPSQLMAQMVEVSRSYEAAQKMVQNEDELLGQTIGSLGRIG